MKPTLTIFTPTYNRAYCLHKCYESMLRQSNKDFVWLIIDDGSTDNTKDLIEGWQNNNNGFEIKYTYKKNGGLHTGYNKAIEVAETELMMCIDSDDYLAENAIEKIISFWSVYGSNEYAGIIGLDVFENNCKVAELPLNQKKVNSIDLLTGKYKIKNGDRKLVIRTDLYKEVSPMPSFDNEKNFNPHYMHLQIAMRYDVLVLNEPLCVVDYQPNGMTNNIFNQYLNSPKSFAQTRRLYMTFNNTSKWFLFKQCVHYVSSCKIAGERNIIRNSPKPFFTMIAYPFGNFLKLYIVNKVK